MALDFDTFLTALYCVIDDLYQLHFAPHKPTRPGPEPKMRDPEILTLTILNQWQGVGSQRSLLRRLHAHWIDSFPDALTQSAFHKRARDLVGVLARLPSLIASLFTTLFGLAATHQTIDGLPIPLMKRSQGERARLFGLEAQIGRGGSERGWYYGFKAMIALDSLGLIRGCVLAPASSGERWSVEALLRQRRFPGAPPPGPLEFEEILAPSHKAGGGRRGPTGPLCVEGAGAPWVGPVLMDRGMRGVDWHAHWRRMYGIDPLCPPSKAQRRADGEVDAWGRRIAGWRQAIETSFSALQREFGAQAPGARSFWGARAELAAKWCAYNMNVLLKRMHGLPSGFHTIRPLELPRE